jgi:hypothetical protein
MPLLRVVLICGGIILVFVGAWSCGGEKRCTDEQLEPFRRYPCGDGTVQCDKSGRINLGPLSPEAQKFVACCGCDTSGAPSCKTCDEMGY